MYSRSESQLTSIKETLVVAFFHLCNVLWSGGTPNQGDESSGLFALASELEFILVLCVMQLFRGQVNGTQFFVGANQIVILDFEDKRLFGGFGNLAPIHNEGRKGLGGKGGVEAICSNKDVKVGLENGKRMCCVL